jgi:hypothetical protein
MRSIVRRWLAVLLNLTLALGAAGCARSGGADKEVLVVSGGAERTLAARTFGVTITFGSDDGAHVSSGATDLDRQLGWLGLGEGPDVEPEQIFVGDTLYLRADQLPRSFGATTPWVLYDHEGMAAAYETYRAEMEKHPPPGVTALKLSTVLPLPEEMPSMIPGIPAAGGPGLFDPAQLLEQLREESVRVEEDAGEEIRGVPATRYRVTLDERRLRREATAGAERQLAQLPAEERKEMREFFMEMARRPAPRLWVWVDGQGLIRRIDLHERLVNEPGKDEDVRSRVELYDFGTPVTVQVPPSNQVTPMHTLQGVFHSPSLDVPATLARVKEWRALSEGAMAGYTWFLERGTAPDGTVCVRVRTDPPLQPLLSLPGPGGNGAVLPEGMEWPGGLEPSMPSGIPRPPDFPPSFEVPPVPDGFPPLPEGATLPEGLVLPPPTPGAGDCDDGFPSPIYEQAIGSGPVSYVYGQVPFRADSAVARFEGEAAALPVTLHGDTWALVFDSTRRLDSVHFLRQGQVVVRCNRISAYDGPSC